MRVLIPSPLHSYTGGLGAVEEQGATLAEVLDRLETRFPGMRFRIVDEQERIRPHIRFFIGARMARDIHEPISSGEEIKIVAALSGG